MRGVMYLKKNANWAKTEVFNRAGLILDPIGGIDTVMTVLAESPGEASGLQPGDRIRAIDGETPSDEAGRYRSAPHREPQREGPSLRRHAQGRTLALIVSALLHLGIS
jgi:C-terminal processing protease CtpA/Prc